MLTRVCGTLILSCSLGFGSKQKKKHARDRKVKKERVYFILKNTR